MDGRARSTYEHGALWTLDLQAPLPAAVTPLCPATFAEAGREETAALAAAMGLPDAGEIRRRFAAGRRCFVERCDGRLAAYGWVSTGPEHVGEMERTFRVPDDEVYIWDCATLPEFRGRRLYSALLSGILVRMRADGVPRAWIGAGLVNRPSVRGIVNAGFQPVVQVVYARRLALHVLRISGEPGAPRPLVRAARRIVLTGREWALGPLVVGIG